MVNTKKFRKKMDFSSEIVRLATFKNWPYNSNHNLSAIKMAAAGFIYNGSKKDRTGVKCYFCGKCLSNWEDNDNPWTEHITHSKNCRFAKLGKPQNEQTISEFLNLLMEYEINTLLEPINYQLIQIHKFYKI